MEGDRNSKPLPPHPHPTLTLQTAGSHTSPSGSALAWKQKQARPAWPLALGVLQFLSQWDWKESWSGAERGDNSECGRPADNLTDEGTEAAHPSLLRRAPLVVLCIWKAVFMPLPVLTAFGTLPWPLSPHKPRVVRDAPHARTAPGRHPCGTSWLPFQHFHQFVIMY